jgi:hypothetical protein
MSNTPSMIVRPIWKGRVAAMLMSAVSLFPSSTLRAERDQRPSLLLGGGAASPPAPQTRDPKLPSGAIIDEEPRPVSPRVACGLRHAVCVHHEPALAPALVAEYLHALEQAVARLVDALGLPAPLSDAGLGPTPGLDLYLSRDAPLDAHVAPDAAHGKRDQRSAFCRARPSRVELSRQAASCVGEALLLGVDAAETPFVRRAIASSLWNLMGPASPRDVQAYDTLQANPQLSVAARETSPEAAGAALFFDYIDARLGSAEPGRLPVAMAALARSQTEPGALRWNDEPDVLDVLRRAFAESNERFEDFMLGFAIERAFLGARDNGRHQPRLAWLGDAGRVRFDWVLKASSLPRRVAPRRPLEPFGSAYVWLDLDRITLGKSLGFRAEWEAPVVMRWSLVTVDPEGNVLRRFDLPFVQNATSAERSILDYDGAAGLLVVGLNLGGVDAANPFDPDHEPFEPHGFTVYLTEL